MSTNIHNFPSQDHATEDSFMQPGASTDPAVKAKLEELQAWTICYNHELLRITRELNELRSRDVKAA